MLAPIWMPCLVSRSVRKLGRPSGMALKGIPILKEFLVGRGAKDAGRDFNAKDKRILIPTVVVPTTARDSRSIGRSLASHAR
eukprot:182046-Prymnesium_polylepis.2